MCIISCDFFSTEIIQGAHKSLLSGLSINLKIWSHRSQGLNESLFGLGWSLLIQCDTIPRRQHVQLIVHVLPIYFFSYIWQMHHHTVKGVLTFILHFLCVRIMGEKKQRRTFCFNRCLNFVRDGFFHGSRVSDSTSLHHCYLWETWQLRGDKFTNASTDQDSSGEDSFRWWCNWCCAPCGTAHQYLYLKTGRRGLGLSAAVVQTRSTMCNPPCKL